MRPPGRLVCVVAAAAVLLLLPAAAGAATSTTDPNALTRPPSMTAPPPGHLRTGRAVQAVADRVAKVREVRRTHPRLTSSVFEKGTDRWQVSYYDGDGTEVAQVLVDDRTGAVLEAWTGPQVAWTMARGYPGAFGRSVNAVYVWIPLLVLFVAPFVDVRRPLRLRHLDLLVLCSFSISLAFFNHGRIDVSVPLVYPPLLYLLGRLLWIGLRRGRSRAAPGPLIPHVPVLWLAVAVLFLAGFRVGLNVTDSNVIDVGYAGVIGADRLAHGQALYGHFPSDNQAGDTYGPFNYAAYVPFEALLPWHGTWDDLPAAHGAAICFDLLCLAGLFLLGRRIRGPTLGVALAWAWASFPFSLYALETNSNDALVAALLIAVLLAASRPVARGVVGALAAATKFAPVALAPLLATHGAVPGDRRRTVLRFALAFAATGAVVLLPVWVHGDVGAFWQRTVAYQAGRTAPFSVWGLWGLPGGLRIAVEALAALLALAVAVVPRRRDVVGLAALAGAVLLALQLTVTYWFYLYLVWPLPLVFVALLAPGAPDERRPAGARRRALSPRARGAARWRRRAAVAMRAPARP